MPEYDKDRDEVISRALSAGVDIVITVGTDLEDSQEAINLAEKYDSIFATAGIHPHEVGEIKDIQGTYERLVSLARHPKVVAIGETGLDYHYLHSPGDTQQEHFRRMIDVAIALELPLVIHSREAKKDTLEILAERSSRNITGVFHCFSGDIDMARKVLDMGFYISFSGVITFKNARKILEVAKYVPLDRILVETDAPYLTPVPFRGKRNEPAFVKYVAMKLSQIHNLPEEKIIEITVNNAKTLFNIH